MDASLNHLRLDQTEQALAPYAPLKGQAAPPDGWLRAVRESLGRSLRVQAGRLGVAAPTLYKSEQAEAQERISLAQLRKLAAGLDCELVYALVPRQPLSQMVQDQAEKLAQQEVLGVTHSMSLEDQRPSQLFVARQVAERRQALLAGPWSKLWR
jgi:predicted DNA-binding mobile mystery protein A